MTLLLLLGGAGSTLPEGGASFTGIGVTVLFEVSESEPFADTQVWHDLTGYIVGPISTNRGRSSEFDEIQAGTLSTTLDATNGDLDPRNGSSPLAACLKPRRRCRLRIIHDEVVYPVFDGFTHGYPRRFQRPNIQGRVDFQASDGFRTIGRTDPTGGLFRLGDPVYGRLGTARLGGSTADDQLSGEFIAAILDSLTWPTTLRDLDEGRVLVSGDIGSRRGLAAMQDANRAEGGDLYVNRSGEFVFRDRLARYTETRSVTSQATFYPDKATPPFYTEPFRIEFDDTRIINEATYTGVSGNPQVYRDQPSITEYGISDDQQTLISVRDQDAQSLAILTVTHNSEPADRIEELVVPCHGQQTVAYPAVLGRELFDQVSVVMHSTYGASPETVPALLQGISHTITSTTFVTTFRLGPVHEHQFFTLGHATLGQLGGVGVLAP